MKIDFCQTCYQVQIIHYHVVQLPSYSANCFQLLFIISFPFSEQYEEKVSIRWTIVKNWFRQNLSSSANHSLSLSATPKLNCTLFLTVVHIILSYHRFCGLHRWRICCLHRKLSCSSFLLSIVAGWTERSSPVGAQSLLRCFPLRAYFLHFQECLQRVKSSLRFIMRPLISPWDYQKMKQALITILPFPLQPLFSWGSWP